MQGKKNLVLNSELVITTLCLKTPPFRFRYCVQAFGKTYLGFLPLRCELPWAGKYHHPTLPARKSGVENLNTRNPLKEEIVLLKHTKLTQRLLFNIKAFPPPMIWFWQVKVLKTSNGRQAQY